MHYIIGVQILIPEKVQNVQSGPVDVTNLARNKPVRVVNETPFKTNVVYTLFNIRPHEGKMLYSFSTDTGEVLPLIFKTPRDADAYIAHIRNENIPNYDAIRRDSF